MEGVAWEEDRSWLRALVRVQRDGHGAGDSWWHPAHSRAAPEEISLQALPNYHPPA